MIVHPGSTGLDPAALQPGRDLVVGVDPLHALALADGVALEDHLDLAARARVDAEARERQAAWHARRAAAYTVDGLDLGWVWEVELLAEVFLPAVRLLRGLEAIGVSHVDFAGFAPELGAAIAAQLGATAGTAPGRSLPPTPPRPVGPAARLLARTGVPMRIRGDLLTFPYWHMGAVLSGLAAGTDYSPVASGLLLAHISKSEALGVAWRGGWLGHAGGRAHGRAGADLERRFATRETDPSDDPLDRALDAQAAELLRARAEPTIADALHFRRALAHKRLRALLLPFDSPGQVRALIGPAREAGLPSAVIQHGYDGRLGDPDKTEADLVCAWSELDRVELAATARGDIRLTGNPGAAEPARASGGGPALVLVENHGRLSATVGERIRLQHVDAALAGLAAARPGSEVVVRPHPSDLTREAFLALGARYPALRVSVVLGGPIDPLLDRAAVVVGAVSTATLEAAVRGVPVVHLNVTGLAQAWPFDGSALPVATDADSLADALGTVRGGEATDAAREALGVRPGAVEAVLEALRTMVT